MNRLYPSTERGRTELGWLDSWHSFSFGEFRDPSRVHFRDLRVINDDVVAPGAGFPTHPHHDMEIVSFIASGAIAHQDSTGSVETLQRHEVQAMTAGSGITHSEFNPSPDEPLRLLQVWLFPREKGLAPKYAQAKFDLDGNAGTPVLLVSPDGASGSLRIEQDARIWALRLEPGGSATVPIGEGRGAWVQMVEGGLEANGVGLAQGDGLALEGEPSLELASEGRSLALVFDLR
jgi:redox-sensitive bicupin YhaK (pirin superfamily)